MDDDRTWAERLDDKIKGNIAETIFEKIHIKLGCQVYRTGQEFLYPHINKAISEKRTKHHQKTRDEILKNETKRYEEFKKSGKSFPDFFGFPQEIKEMISPNDTVLPPDEKSLGQVRFQQIRKERLLFANPDFTIITPSGDIIYYEVKYRSKIEDLKISELYKYLDMDIKPNIFVVTRDEPHIHIIKPFIRDEDESSDPSKKLDVLQKWAINRAEFEVDILHEGGTLTPIERVRWILDRVSELIEKEADYSYCAIQPEKDGSIIIKSRDVPLTKFPYPGDILKECYPIIIKWYPQTQTPTIPTPPPTID